MCNSDLSLEEQFKQGLIQPGNPVKFFQNIELQFQDNVVENLVEQNKKILLTESAGSKNQSKHLLVTVEGIHTGMTKNLTFYPGSALEASVPTWVEPHNKPVIKNHDISEEPLGRIVKSEYVESTLVDKYTVRLTLKITDEDAINKILDGRYLTLSVGGSANRVNCSICGKDLVQEGWCGHSRGRKYENKQAYWTIGDYTGDEISFVNAPADVFAQVISAELVTGEGGSKVEGGQKENQQEENKQGVSTTESASGLIDGLLGDENPAQQQENTQTAKPGAKPEDPKNQQEDNENQGEKETLEEKVLRLEKELLEMTQKRDTLVTENTSLVADKEQVKKDYDEMKKHKEAAEAERDTFKSQNLKLAKFARRSMAERVVDLRMLQGKEAKDADREALVQEWAGSTSKVLESTIADLLLSSKRTIEHVANPGIVTDDKNTIPVDENNQEISKPAESAKAEKPKIKTLKDLSEGMTSYLTKNY